METDTENEGAAPAAERRSRRSEDLGDRFEEGRCVGWVFGVPDCFRTSLDVAHSHLVDREKETQNGRKAVRRAWTRGSPPQRSFDVGDVFYDPPEARDMVWSEALKVLRRSVHVLDGRGDGKEAGWAQVAVTEYVDGVAIKATEAMLSQEQLEELLWSGDLPEGAVPAGEEEHAPAPSPA